MKLIKSQFELLDFFVINTKYRFIDPSDDVNVKDCFASYAMDIDFMPRVVNGQYYVYIKISINENEKPLPGYSLFVEGVCVFDFADKENLTEDIISEYISNSGVSIAISSLRNFISNITQYFPFGKFTFPVVDLTSLINQKKEQAKNHPKEKKSKSKK